MRKHILPWVLYLVVLASALGIGQALRCGQDKEIASPVTTVDELDAYGKDLGLAPVAERGGVPATIQK